MTVIDAISHHGGVWINPPPRHRLENDQLQFETDAPKQAQTNVPGTQSLGIQQQ